MKKIFSKTNPDLLICSILKFNNINEKRCDISPNEEFIQVSGRKLKKDFEVSAHKHNRLDRKITSTQEAWILLKGKILSKFYDLDDSFLHEETLEKGDCIAIFRGGHELKVLEDDTIFYEIKNGPYFGVEKDKSQLI